MKKIAIHSVPRSGSTWLGNIFNSHPDVNFSYQPLFSYAFKDGLKEESTLKEIITFFNNIAHSDDPFIRQKEGIEKGIIPDFIKSHTYTHVCYKSVRYHNVLENVLEKDSDVKVIGLVRNPFSVINSWLNAPKEFRNDLEWKVEEEWEFAPKKNKNKPEEFNGFHKWKETTKFFLTLKRKFPNRFYLLNYDELLNDTLECTKTLFDFCELTISDQTLNFIKPKNQKNHLDAYSVFKSKSSDDGWKNSLPDYIIKSIQQDEEFISLNKVFKWLK